VEPVGPNTYPACNIVLFDNVMYKYPDALIYVLIIYAPVGPVMPIGPVEPNTFPTIVHVPSVYFTIKLPFVSTVIKSIHLHVSVSEL
jgi:hypothetical protein